MNAISASFSAPFPLATSGQGIAHSSKTTVSEGAAAGDEKTPSDPRKRDEGSRRLAGQGDADRSAGAEQGLSQDELRQLTELKARDREVRAHEAAHQAAGGQYAGAMSLTYERGPDGAQYAVGGEVSIDMSPISGDPEATIDKMQVVRAAAMAPAEPSAQDRAVAAEAMQIMLQARSELAAGGDGAEDSQAKAGQTEGEGPARVGRQGRDTYQSVAAMDDESGQQRSGFSPVAA